MRVLSASESGTQRLPLYVNPLLLIEYSDSDTLRPRLGGNFLFLIITTSRAFVYTLSSPLTIA
jgi:hypothetical protein